MLAASNAADTTTLEALLQQFKSSTCTYRSYTDLSMKVDLTDQDDLGDFTLVSIDDAPVRRPRPIDKSVHKGAASTRSIFDYVTEGAGKAWTAFIATSENLLFEAEFSATASVEADLLARRTRNIAAHWTQRYLNSMLITAIERNKSAIVDILLDFEFRLQSVPRPSLSLPAHPADTSVHRDDVRANPLDLEVNSPGVANWLSVALQPRDDTALLAVIRSNHSCGLFSRLLKTAPHLANLPSTGGVLPLHLIAALGRSELLRSFLASQFSTGVNSR
uniref:Transcriptional regulator n=1 Tax=Mesocestoides corti TaxID=53468 RepID=A0A5K3FAM1_MESCO